MELAPHGLRKAIDGRSGPDPVGSE